MKLQHLIVISSLVMGTDVGEPESALAAEPLASADSPLAQHKPVIIAIVVDQLAAWVLRERIDKLPVDGGFARLRREGKYYQEMAYAHAITETAPGHASLFTGKLPREHGIIANDVLGPDGKKQATIADPSESNKLVSLEGSPVKGMGSSLAKLDTKSDLVATAFRHRYPKGQGIIAALSLKDRGTLFAAGEDADYAIWFDPKQRGIHDGAKERGGFVTSKWYASSLQKSGLGAFVRGYLATGNKDDKRDGIERLEDLLWQGMDPTWLNENIGTPISSDYTGFIDAHTASQASKPGAAFRALPDSDRLLLAMALQILKVESQELPVFLSVSLSANDYIGHLFGPDSWEAWDELRRLDDTLAWFFKQLDQLRPHAWSVVLSADHGSVPPEDDVKRPKCGENPKSALDSGKPCSRSQAAGARIFTENLKSDAEKVAAQAALLGASGATIDKVIAGVVYPYIYLTESAKAATRGDPAARARLAERLSSGLQKKFKGVQAVLDVTPFRMAPTCPDEHASILAALVCHSISPDPERGGDFYVVLKPGAFFDPDLAKGVGISHGSPYGYDRFVPMFVRDSRHSDLAGQVEQKRVPFTLFRDELVRMVANANAQEK